MRRDFSDTVSAVEKASLKVPSISFREKKLLTTIYAHYAVGTGKHATTLELARMAFPQIRPITKADRAVRNNIRRLLKYKAVKRAKPGIYAPAR